MLTTVMNHYKHESLMDLNHRCVATQERAAQLDAAIACQRQQMDNAQNERIQLLSMIDSLNKQSFDNDR